MAITGSIEIQRGSESIGVVGQAWVVADVPIVLGNLHGIKGMKVETPAKQPTGRTPTNQWSGTDAQGRAVRIFLWQDVPFNETSLGQAIARAIAES